MKKIIGITLLIFVNQIIAQKKIDYKDPVFEFDNFKKFPDENERFFYNPALYTELDLRKLNYKKKTNSDNIDGVANLSYYVDIPFYVNKEILDKNDFVLFLFNPTSWAILNRDKKPIVKSFDRIKKHGVTFIRQLNENLRENIKYPGKYYLRFIVSEIEKKELLKRKTKKNCYVYLGRVENKGD